ncbi:MAG TPA: RHS repeat-associated core domain-containing protein [Isosphaeraceae bacterium]|nr:RHS repeat-associated core domain-containing protein [Isosphaeraceae bacterium]
MFRHLTSRIPAILSALLLLSASAALRADTSTATITQPTGAVTLYAGQTQLFAGTTDTGGTITWAFGDGGTASGAAVSHTYATAGSYTAVMTVAWAHEICSRWNTDGTCSATRMVTTTYTASRSITVLGKPTISAFTASASSIGSGASVTLSWTVSQATALTLSPGGALSGTSVVVHPTATTTYTLTASNPAGAATATTTVTVVPLTVSITPATVTLPLGGQATFSASVSGGSSPSQAVTWSVVGSGAGTITAAGAYTAPSAPGTYTVKAVASQDGLSAGTAKVTVQGWVLKLKKDILYVGTKEVAEVDASGKTWVTFEDHLGSPRYQWDGTAVTGIDGVHLIAQKYAPFGEYLNDPTTQAQFAKGFTNHEQTDPSGLIYMQARFYAPMYGRFLSPDPARDQHFEQTQTWNIFSYVRNQPTMQIDPTGMQVPGKERIPASKAPTNRNENSGSAISGTKAFDLGIHQIDKDTGAEVQVFNLNGGIKYKGVPGIGVDGAVAKITDAKLFNISLPKDFSIRLNISGSALDGTVQFGLVPQTIKDKGQTKTIGLKPSILKLAGNIVSGGLSADLMYKGDKVVGAGYRGSVGGSAQIGKDGVKGNILEVGGEVRWGRAETIITVLLKLF